MARTIFGTLEGLMDGEAGTVPFGGAHDGQSSRQTNANPGLSSGATQLGLAGGSSGSGASGIAGAGANALLAGPLASLGAGMSEPDSPTATDEMVAGGVAGQQPGDAGSNDWWNGLRDIVDAAEKAATITKEAAGASLHYGVNNLLEHDFGSQAWQSLSTKLHGLEKIGQGAEIAGHVLTGLKFAFDAVDIWEADSPEDYAKAVSQTVRDLATTAAGWAGAKGGAMAGGAIGATAGGVGALIGAPLGALFGGLGASWAAGAAYDTWAADAVEDFAVQYYDEWQAMRENAANLIR
ncbi:MAG: hypothetical protein ISS72_05935 [Candidatus Brocadiae bacterium]|nr:hypothetical protein [Candidatus Brocadiia bacterium]